MKRKLLLISLMLVLFTCILAISVGAKTIYKDTNGNELFSYETDSDGIISSYSGEFPKEDENGNALTWYVTATQTVGNNTEKTVASVLTNDSAYFSITDGKYSYTGKTVTQYNVVSVNFSDNMGIEILNLANGGYRTNNTYSYNPTSTELLFIYLPSTLTELPERFLQGSKVLACDMPTDMPIEKISHVSFYDARCLREINIPSTVTIIDGINGEKDGAAFFRAVSLERVTISPNSQLEAIGPYAFYLSGLKYITLPDTVNRIETYAFGSTKIIDSPFTSKSQLKRIGGRAFNDCDSLKNIIIPSTLEEVVIFGNNDYGPFTECTGIDLVTFGDYQTVTSLPPSLFARANIGTIVLPDGPTHIPNRFFINANVKEVAFSNTIETADERVFQASTVEVIRLGANFKHFTNTIVDHHSFTNASNNIKEIYIPASFYKDAPDTVYQVSYAFNCGNSSNIKFYYTGTLDELTVSLDNFKSSTKSATDNNWKFTGAKLISYLDYVASPESYQNSNCIIYGYNLCDAFYESKHDNKVEISYSDYAKAGIKTSACQNGCGLMSEESVDAIISYKGVSAKNDGDKICVGYTVNLEAKSIFESVNKTSFTYGIVASVPTITTNNPLKVENGSVVALVPERTVNAVISDTYTGFDFIMGGFTEANYATELIICAYVYDGKNIGYMCSVNGQLTQLNEATTISYNQLAN